MSPPPDHVVDINDGDLMRAADVQQAVQPRHQGAGSGNLDGRSLLHKVVLHVHDDHGGFLGDDGILHLHGLSSWCMISWPAHHLGCRLLSRTCCSIIAQRQIGCMENFGVMARGWSPLHDERQGASSGWNVVVSRAGNRNDDFADSTVHIRIEDSRIQQESGP